jgi:hypothetical protein
MNERIEKISEQARQYADSMYPSGLDIAKWGPAYQEKFAELIVRECVQAVKNVGGYNEDYHMNAIKKYFGVEE